MKKESYFKRALKTKQGKTSLYVLLISTALCFLVCILLADTKLVYLALLFALVSVAASNNIIKIMGALREYDR